MEKSEFEINLHFEKGGFFLLTFEIDGKIETDCDRCTETFWFPIADSHPLIVKFDDNIIPGTDPADEMGDVVYIPRGQTHLNVAKYLYEFVILSIPIKKVHSDDEEGNPGCEISYEANFEEDIKDKEEIDPRWEALKNIKKN